MADTATPPVNTPPAREGRSVGKWIGQHRIVVLGAAGVGAFLLLSHRGQSVAVDSTSDLPAVDETTTDPIPDVTDDPSLDDPVIPDAPDIPDTPTEDPTASDPTPAAPAAAPAAPPSSPATAKAVTVAGIPIPGAVSETQTGSGTNSYGHYGIHLVKFKAGTAYYWHYTSGKSAGKVTGPHSPKGSVPAAAHVSTEDDTPANNANPGRPTTPTHATPSPPPAPASVPHAPAPAAESHGVDVLGLRSDGTVFEAHVYTSGPKNGTMISMGERGKVKTPAQQKNPPAGWTASVRYLKGHAVWESVQGNI